MVWPSEEIQKADTVLIMFVEGASNGRTESATYQLRRSCLCNQALTGAIGLRRGMERYRSAR